MSKFKAGDKVKCNGNPEGRVLNSCGDRMYTVRLWQGRRCVGEVVAFESELLRENPAYAK
jgi:hypothetical protein